MQKQQKFLFFFSSLHPAARRQNMKHLHACTTDKVTVMHCHVFYYNHYKSHVLLTHSKSTSTISPANITLPMDIQYWLNESIYVLEKNT